MFNHKNKLAITLISFLAITACSDDDTNTDELAEALREQNQILSEQLEQQNEEPSFIISGVVVDAFDDQLISNAIVSVSTPIDTLVDSLVVTDGQFVLPDMPINTSLEIVIESSDDTFLRRVFYRSTGSTESTDAVVDFGQFEVSEGETYEFQVLSSNTNMPIADLEFSGSSAFGSGSSESEFLHVSTFDEVNENYTITIPKFLFTSYTASIDSNRDGVPDFELEDFQFRSGTDIRIQTSDFEDLDVIRVLEEEEIFTELQLRLAIVGSGGSLLTTPQLNVENNENDLEVEVDTISSQFVLNAVFDGFIFIEIPAFSENGVNYSSLSLTLSSNNSEGEFNISTSNGLGDSFYFVPVSEVISIAIQPREIVNPSSDFQEVFILDPEDSQDNSLNIFYSSSFSIDPSQVSLINIDDFVVTKGNDSNDDLVLNGFTSIEGEAEVPVNITVSLNNTRLTVEPAIELGSDQFHRYSVGGINIDGVTQSIDLNNDDSISFNSLLRVGDTPFDINDLVLDNNNFTTNGETIVLENTAGEMSFPSNSRDSVYLIFPQEINQLQQFSMTSRVSVENGAINSFVRQYRIVENGVILIGDMNLVSLARNESVDFIGTNSFNFLLGTAQADRKGVHTTTTDFLSDNIVGSENSISFDYAFETKAGEVFTGTINLSVE